MAKTYTRKFTVPKELYNVDLKNRFIEYYYDKEYTKENVRKLFYLTNYYLEGKKDKDICECSKDELEQLLFEFKAKTVNSLNSKVSLLRQYIDFTINVAGERKNASNYLDDIVTADLTKYVATSVYKYMYITRDRLYQICNMIYNPQDAVAYVLLFEGVKGKELIELRSLKSSDIDMGEKTITIRGYQETEKNGDIKDIPTRVIENVDERTLEIIKMAIAQSIYYRGNSIDTAMGKSLDRELELDSTDYILRKALLNIETDVSGGMIEKQVVSNRMNKVAKYIASPELVTMLNPTNLFYSGMLDELLKIREEKGSIDHKDLRKVVVSRGMHKNSYFGLKKVWEEFYGDEEE